LRAKIPISGEAGRRRRRGRATHGPCQRYGLGGMTRRPLL
jgi:hypothetical protein